MTTDLEPARDYTFERAPGDILFYEEDAGKEVAGNWAPCDLPDIAFRAKCPGPEDGETCGWVFRAAEEHEVDEDGEVSPSVGCPHCGFHAWATLKDWDPEEE